MVPPPPLKVGQCKLCRGTGKVPRGRTGTATRGQGFTGTNPDSATNPDSTTNPDSATTVWCVSTNTTWLASSARQDHDHVPWDKPVQCPINCCERFQTIHRRDAGSRGLCECWSWEGEEIWKYSHHCRGQDWKDQEDYVSKWSNAHNVEQSWLRLCMGPRKLWHGEFGSHGDMCL